MTGPSILAIDNYDSFTFTLVDYLLSLGASVTVEKNDTVTVEGALAGPFDGFLTSPGPGKPEDAGISVGLAAGCIAAKRPLLGICLGHQIVGRAAGAETRRLRYGHHGANHPVRDVETGLVQVTAQNHEVQVVGDTLPRHSGFRVSQLNLNDGSVEGLRHVEKPVETVQYHPEGAPGPLDALAVFDRFVFAAGERRRTMG
jgi:carbamoyl-phosphate synthase small subunit